MTPPALQVEEPEPKPQPPQSRLVDPHPETPLLPSGDLLFQEDQETQTCTLDLAFGETLEDLPDGEAFSDHEPPTIGAGDETLEDGTEVLMETPGSRDREFLPLPDVDEGDKIENLNIHLAKLDASTKALMSELFRANYIRHIPPK